MAYQYRRQTEYNPAGIADTMKDLALLNRIDQQGRLNEEELADQRRESAMKSIQSVARGIVPILDKAGDDPAAQQRALDRIWPSVKQMLGPHAGEHFDMSGSPTVENVRIAAGMGLEAERYGLNPIVTESGDVYLPSSLGRAKKLDIGERKYQPPQMRDVGGAIISIDPYTNEPRAEFPKTQSRESIASGIDVGPGRATSPIFYGKQQPSRIFESALGEPVDLDRLGSAIKKVESDGNYSALGPITKNGDRGLGAYQVMSSNVRDWTKQATGKSYTPDEFLNSPELQDRVFQDQMQRHFASGIGLIDAPAIWHSGDTYENARARNASDGNMNTVNDYVPAVGKEYIRLGEPNAAPGMAVPGVAEAKARQAAMEEQAKNVPRLQQRQAESEIAMREATEKEKIQTAAKIRESGLQNMNAAKRILSQIPPQTRDLIRQSTGSDLGQIRDRIGRIVGYSGPGKTALDALKTISARLVSEAPRLGGSTSNFDVELYKQQVSDMGNPDIPVQARLKAFDTAMDMIRATAAGGFNPGITAETGMEINVGGRQAQPQTGGGMTRDEILAAYSRKEISRDIARKLLQGAP